MNRFLVMVMRTLLAFAIVAIIWSSSLAVASKEPVVITVFIPSKDTTASNGKCAPNMGVRPILRFVQTNPGSNQAVVRMPLVDGTLVPEDNDFVPGDTGCNITRTLALDPTSDYRATLGVTEIVTLKADMMTDGVSLAMFLSLHDVSGSPTGHWLLPEAVTSNSTPTLSPTQDPTQEPTTPTPEISRTPRGSTGRVTRVAINPTPTPTSAPTADEIDWTFTPRVDGLERAETVIFSNINEGALFTEPIALTFVAYQFEDEGSAEAAMVTLCDHAEANLQVLSEAEYLKEVSIGRIGDDRCAFSVDEPDNAMAIWTVVRAGDQVLVTLALGIGGDYPDYVGGFLETHVAIVSAEDIPILPELADMPRGWEAGPAPQDITDQARIDASPEATP